MEAWIPKLVSWGGPLAITLLLTVFFYWLIGKAFALQPNNRLYRQLAYVGLVLGALITLLIALPFDVATRGQLLSLFGLVVTAVIALSSTTFVSNAMAGLMLKATGSFHTGDFIRVTEHFGRVTTKALLHTELQSVDRDILTLPNLFLITNPIQVVDQSGTLISCELSIGYDVHRRQLSRLLVAAAKKAELTDPFVQIVNLGDYAVTYKITGFLENVGKIVTKRSELKATILDTLHDANIEIMTPTIMDQRPITKGEPIIPPLMHHADEVAESGKAEKLMFDKAELATRIERFREHCLGLRKEIEALKDEDEDANQAEIGWRRHQLEALEDIIEKFDNADD